MPYLEPGSGYKLNSINLFLKNTLLVIGGSGATTRIGRYDSFFIEAERGSASGGEVILTFVNLRSQLHLTGFLLQLYDLEGNLVHEFTFSNTYILIAKIKARAGTIFRVKLARPKNI